MRYSYTAWPSHAKANLHVQKMANEGWTLMSITALPGAKGVYLHFVLMLKIDQQGGLI